MMVRRWLVVSGALVMTATGSSSPGKPWRMRRGPSAATAACGPKCDQRRRRLDAFRAYLARPLDAFLQPLFGNASTAGADLAVERWRTCAVVSNSARMLNHRLGDVVDSADAVLRFNDGKTAGFEAFVGSKTTVRMANHAFASRSARGDRTSTLVIQGPSPGPRLANRAYHLNTSAGGDGFVEVVANVTNVRWATSGLLGVVLMLRRCRTVRVFELAPSETSDGGRCHYAAEPPDKGALAKVDCRCPHQCRLERAFVRYGAARSDALRRDGWADLTVESVARCLESGKCDPRPWSAYTKAGTLAEKAGRSAKGAHARKVH